MSIRVLPKATSHLLGSAQVLTTPASLVKELVDNALDAKATSIDVVISANTLDKIEVRDNGHGIAPSDLDALGRRGYTSKLRGFEEMRIVGGSTLGFRGEALASAVDLGEVSVTTRTEGEGVAAKVKLQSHGGVASQIPTSHPIGTTVFVSNLFSQLPVRKEKALKEAKRSLSRIKELLQSYALARLNVRMSLKVLKATNSNWSFAPRTNDGIREIVSQVIGRDIAAQCTEETGTLSIPSQPGTSVTESGFGVQRVLCDYVRTQESCNTQFVIHAFIPKLDAEFSKTNGNQYLSIDSRPVSCARGTPKKIIGIYKSAIWTVAAETTSKRIKNPFIRMDIKCPLGSYDANVEPAKDNVLFEDESLILSLVERWLKSIYVCREASPGETVQQPQGQEDDVELVNSPGKIQPNDLSKADPSTREKPKELESDKRTDSTFDLEIDHKHPGPSLDINASSQQSEVGCIMNILEYGGSQIDMSEDLSEEPSLGNLTKGSISKVSESMIEPEETNNALNPWLIARLNAPVTAKRAPGLSLPSNAPTFSNRRLAKSHGLPTTRGSSMSPEPYQTPTRGSTSRKPLASSCNPQNSLDIWLKQSQTDHLRNSDNPQMNTPNSSGDSTKSATTFSHVNLAEARQRLCETQCSPPATQGRLASDWLARNNKPFVSPTVRFTIAKPHFLEESSIVNELSSRSLESDEATPDIFCDMRVNQHKSCQQADVDDALDFERRKEAATRRLREEHRRSRKEVGEQSSIVSNTKSSPRKDMDNATINSLDASQKLSRIDIFPDKFPVKTCLPDDDPRAYLIRRQQSVAAYSEQHEIEPKLNRAKTLLLPLERVPKSAETHNLVQVVSTDVSLLKKSMLKLKAYDGYSNSSCQVMGLDISSADLMKIQRKLENVVKVWLRDTTGEQNVPQISLSGLEGRSVGKLQKAGTAGTTQ